MGTFADEAEVNRYLGDIFIVALGHDEVGPKVRDAGLALRINHTQPDATIHVDMANGVVTTGAAARGQEGEVALRSSSRTTGRPCSRSRAETSWRRRQCAGDR